MKILSGCFELWWSDKGALLHEHTSELRKKNWEVEKWWYLAGLNSLDMCSGVTFLFKLVPVGAYIVLPAFHYHSHNHSNSGVCCAHSQAMTLTVGSYSCSATSGFNCVLHTCNPQRAETGQELFRCKAQG